VGAADQPRFGVRQALRQQAPLVVELSELILAAEAEAGDRDLRAEVTNAQALVFGPNSANRGERAVAERKTAVVEHMAAADVAAGCRDADWAEAAAIAEQHVEGIAATLRFRVARARRQTVAPRRSRAAAVRAARGGEGA